MSLGLPAGLARLLADPLIEERLSRLPRPEAGFGVDPFGFDPTYLRHLAPLATWLYRRWFRVQPRGLAKVPAGRCLLVANHAGQLPWDGLMIGTALFLEAEPPRVVRSMVERFVPATPFVSYLLPRIGQIVGTPENARALLAQEELLLVFPEGVRGLNKTWRERYRLQEFGRGFMRLAIETSTPIVPVAVIGSEEQTPSFYNARALGRLLGLPAFPITPTHPLLPGIGLLPYPSRYQLLFGDPMHFKGDPHDEDEVIDKRIALIRVSLQTLIAEGRARRRGVFR